MSLKVVRLLRRLHLINLSNIYAILKKKDHSESCVDGYINCFDENLFGDFLES